MQTYEYICTKCENKKEIYCPISERYTPDCCNQPMKRVYSSAPTILPGALDYNNLTK